MSEVDKEKAGDCSEEFVEDEDSGSDKSFGATMRKAEAVALLPKVVRRRIKALKKHQFDCTVIEAEFFKEVHRLECLYHDKYQAFYEKRRQIVNGEHEPNDAECDWPSEDEDEDLAEDLKQKAKLEENKDVKGVPEFWLKIFRNVGILSEMTQPHDEPILAHLKDIHLTCTLEPMSFKLDFIFAPNEYFEDTVLSKVYYMKCAPEQDDPFTFEGPEIYKCTGCTINWKQGKNVTLKTVKKKQKHKSRGVVRTITKTMKNDSFFNFFDPPILPEDTKSEDVDDDLRELLTNDFEIGHYIKERVVPKAVLYFTGELEDEDDFDEDEDEDEDEEYLDDGEDHPGQKNQGENCKQQ